MKKRRIILFIILLTAISLTACGRDKKNEAEPTVSAQNTTPSAGVTGTVSPAELTPTGTPDASPTPKIPSVPEGYSAHDVVTMMDDEIAAMEFTYRETFTHNRQTDIRPYYRVDMARKKLSASPEPYLADDLEGTITYNRELRYFDTDLRPVKSVLFLNASELITFYETKYGTVIDHDGSRYYCFEFSVYDDSGRLIYQKNRRTEYCSSYDADCDAFIGAEYQDGDLASYAVNFYDSDGRVAEYAYYGRTEAEPTPKLRVRSVLTYDAKGNCVAMDTERFDDQESTADVGEAAGHYDFEYDADSLGRLIGRTITFTAPDGRTDKTTIGFKYYDNGPVLVYGRDLELYNKQYYDLRDAFFPAETFLVFLPGEETSRRLTTCSDLMPMFRYSEYCPSSDRTQDLYGASFFEPLLCNGTELQYDNSGIDGLLGLPSSRSQGSDKYLLKFAYYENTASFTAALLAQNNYNGSRFDQDILSRFSGSVKAEYSDDNSRYVSYMLSDASGETAVFLFDENGCIKQMVKYEITTDFYYDRQGYLVDWHSHNDHESYTGLGRLQYDADGKLTLMTTERTAPEYGERTTTYLAEYTGDGSN